MSAKTTHKNLDKFSDINLAAVALLANDIGYHLGVIYRNNGATTTKVIHLAWHHRLKDEPTTEVWAWVPSDIDTDRLADAAALCRLIARNPAKKKAPYGFEFGDSGIDAKGAVFIGGSSVGLTCATFVLALFRRIGIELLDVSTWKQRPDDEKAWETLFASLKETKGIDPKHLTALENQKKCMRYRPEEVAASSSVGPWPMPFDLAVVAGKNIEDYILRVDTPQA